MSLLGTYNLTLLDAVKRRDPNGSQAKIVEMLDQMNEILKDMVWRPTNGVDVHKTTLRTSLGEAYFKLMNLGTRMSKSTTAQITETCAKIERWQEVDKDLVDQEDDKEAFLMSETAPAIEKLGETLARYLFYGNKATEPEAFTGLAPRMNALTGDAAKNIISASGSGSDNTSIWFVIWGEQTVHGIYRKNLPAGLQVDDKGAVTTDRSDGTAQRLLDVYRQKYSWECGLAMRDWQGVARICNIDISNLRSFSSAANLNEKMIQAYHRILRKKGSGKAAIYMNSDVAMALDLQRTRIQNSAASDTGVNLGGGISMDMIDGEMRYTFRGIPIRIVDQLVNTEAAVA